MTSRKHMTDTLKIGAGIVGIKEGIGRVESDMLGSAYAYAAGCGDLIYNISLSGADYFHIMPENELLAGFTIGVVANLTAGFIKSEYGSLANFMRRKKLSDEFIYSRFI
ncbi:MAG: hypothetical protein KAS90_06630 [Candidatus Aenigmarchaeota archaeon]|nr:hypothetical protein [Candidatus Aenigmarchaeota archaeon]